MVYFLTNKKNHTVVNNDSVTVLSMEEGFPILEKLLQDKAAKQEYLGLDLETTGLDAYKHSIVLTALGDTDNQFVLHHDIVNEPKIIEIYQVVKQTLQIGMKLLGFNLKFDLGFTKVKYDVITKKLYDVMIAEQRIYQRSGVGFGLKECCQRHLKYIPEHMIKDTRFEFVGVNPDSFIVNQHHVMYAATDVSKLHEIKANQEKMIEKYNLGFLIHDIESPLVSILCKSELAGFNLDKTQWLNIVEDNKKKKFELECQLDDELRKLRNEKFIRFGKKHEDYYYLAGGKYDRPRVANTQNNQLGLGLFGLADNKVTDVAHDSGNLNYSSPPEIIEIFAKLKEPLPTKEGLYLTPIIKGKKVLKGEAKAISVYGEESIVKTEGFTTEAGALEAYLIEQSKTPMRRFLELLLEHRTVTHELDSFGVKFFDKINPVTGRIHTIYRQAAADTGRLQSGGGRNQSDRINIQNIPARKVKDANGKEYAPFRVAFTVDEGYEVVTSDLSGAELIILCDKANDMKLLELSKGDMHSHMANLSWRKVYDYSNLPYTDDLIISKKQNKDKRDAFKPMTFGTIYGMKGKKAGKTLNISKEAGEVVIDTIKSEIPATFAYVEGCVESVLGKKMFDQVNRSWYYTLGNPYLVLNNRTNSRVWFMDVYYAKANNAEIGWKIASEIDGNCRNYTIQGTQADMIKEAMVEIDDYIESQNLDAVLLASVHDELVYKFRTGTVVSTSEGVMPFGDFVAYMMKTVANRYLSNVKMDAEFHVAKTWVK